MAIGGRHDRVAGRCHSQHKLTSIGRDGGWNTKVVTKWAQSPHHNVSELGFLASSKRRVWKEGYRSINEMLGGTRAMFAEYNNEMLERVWQEVEKTTKITLGTSSYMYPRRGIHTIGLGSPRLFFFLLLQVHNELKHCNTLPRITPGCEEHLGSHAPTEAVENDQELCSCGPE